MNQSPKTIMLVIEEQIYPDQDYAFEQWYTKSTTVLHRQPGFISQTIKQPQLPIQRNWIIMHYFDSLKHALSWLQSDARKILQKELLPLTIGSETIYVIDPDIQHSESVSALISHHIKPTDIRRFLEIQSQFAPLQSKFPGFIGYKLEKPRHGVHDSWIATVTFDTESNLDAWLNSSERAKLLTQLDKFAPSTLEKIHSGFDFWFTKKTETRSAWKENALVLLTLYPVVFLISFIQNPLIHAGWPFWFTLFLSNALSTSILGWITVPFLRKQFEWWLNPPADKRQIYTLTGAVLVIFFYIIIIVSARYISHIMQ
jgi:uncharacterized protein